MINSSYIDSDLILEAMIYYKSLGYSPASVPMLVDHETTLINLPENRNPLSIDTYDYIGSAEQSFYQLISENKLADGKYMALTPCHRDEPTIDDEHFSIFLKLELFSVRSEYDETILNSLRSNCFKFFKRYSDNICYDESNGDILINGIEVGSYGENYISDKHICYGTGIAEPRFSYAIKSN